MAWYIVDRPGGSVIRSWRLWWMVGADNDTPDSDSKSRTGSTARFIHLSRSRIEIRLGLGYRHNKTRGVSRFVTSYVSFPYYTSKDLIPRDFSIWLTVNTPRSQHAAKSRSARDWTTSGVGWSVDRPMVTKGRRCHEPVARSNAELRGRKTGNTLSPRHRGYLPNGYRRSTAHAFAPRRSAHCPRFPGRRGTARASPSWILRDDNAQKPLRNRQ